MQHQPEGEVIINRDISDAYTFVLRQGHLEIYETAKGPTEKRRTPDMLLLPNEVGALAQFIQTFTKMG